MWCDVRKAPWKMLDEKEAYRNHNKKEQYCVLVEIDDILTHVIEIGKNDILIRFLDEDKFSYLCYSFLVKEQGKLFLKGADYTDYEATGEERERVLFNFFENGCLLMEKINRRTGESEEFESTVDLETNWDNYPKFGDYTHLLIEERE